MPPHPLSREVDAGPALRAAGALGPFFVWEPRDDGGWRPLTDLLEPDVLTERVGGARRALVRRFGLSPDDVGEREVASITFLGYAGRLLSPLLGAVAVAEALPLPELGRLWWRPVEAGPLPIAYDGLLAAGCADAGAATVAGTLTATATLGLLEPMVEVFGRRFSLPAHLLWGNVASALGGAAGVIADRSPAHAERGAAVVAQALGRAPLAGTARLERPDPERARWFLVRRNCCLYYRIPGGGTCGDCVLTPEDVRREQWQSVLSR